MNREKNIMKIRNLGLSKCRRVQTENNMKWIIGHAQLINDFLIIFWLILVNTNSFDQVIMVFVVGFKWRLDLSLIRNLTLVKYE